MHKITVTKLLALDDGGKYAPVKERILALRNSDHRYSLKTEVVFITEANGWLATSTLTILDTGETYTGNSFVAMNRGTTIQRNFPVEDAETSADGRAFAKAGIGIDEAFASYEEMAKARELAKTQPDTKVAAAINDLNKVIEKKKADKKYKDISYLDASPMVDAADEPKALTGEEGDELEEASMTVSGTVQPESPLAAILEEIKQDEEAAGDETEVIAAEPVLAEVPLPTREELIADDSPIMTGKWDEKPKTTRRKEVNKTVAEKPIVTKSPKTVAEITGKGVTDHMKEVFSRLMQHGVNPFDYPERNTDAKFDAIEQAWNRGEEEFVVFVKQEWGIRFTSMHKHNLIVEQEQQEEEPHQTKLEVKASLMLDNGKTIAENIAAEREKYGMKPTVEAKEPVKTAEPMVQPKPEIDLVMPDPPVNTGGMQPNQDFLNKKEGGTMEENFKFAGNKFGIKIIPAADRANPSLFTKWVIGMLSKGVDIETSEMYFEKHHLSKTYSSFEALLRTGTEEDINEFLNRH